MHDASVSQFASARASACAHKFKCTFGLSTVNQHALARANSRSIEALADANTQQIAVLRNGATRSRLNTTPCPCGCTLKGNADPRAARTMGAHFARFIRTWETRASSEERTGCALPEIMRVHSHPFDDPDDDRDELEPPRRRDAQHPNAAKALRNRPRHGDDISRGESEAFFSSKLASPASRQRIIANS